jgi:ABC-type glycerol-3-phosphate transport system substrate-binding protein
MFANAIAVLTRVAVQDDARTVVTMASLSPNQRFVHEFNNQSSEYRIVVLDYSDDDISAALTRFNIDMIAGNIPDIIDFTYLDYRNLASSGFLVDLNMWFDHDDDISHIDFHERVFELLAVDGNLYAVVPSFMIKTCLAPASLVGTTPGMALDRLMQLDVQFNDGNSLLQDMSSQSFIDMHTMVSRSTLIDFNMGIARFETDDFIQVLVYASRLEHYEAITLNDEFIPFEINIRRGNDHISPIMINSLDQLYQIELYAGKQITPIGFPVDDGVGSLMLPVSLFGIGRNAQNPSGAWAFLKFMLTTMQKEVLYGIPASRSVFDEWVNHSMNPPPLGDNPHLSNEIFVDGVLIEITPLTRDQANRTLKMIETLGDVLVDGDEIVAYIVAEEFNAFLRGNRSAEDTARIIQSRVQIYVAERQR